MNELMKFWRWLNDLPEDLFWSFSHENKNAPTGDPPLKLKKREDVSRNWNPSGPQTPKPEIVPTGQGHGSWPKQRRCPFSPSDLVG